MTLRDVRKLSHTHILENVLTATTKRNVAKEVPKRITISICGRFTGVTKHRTGRIGHIVHTGPQISLYRSVSEMAKCVIASSYGTPTWSMSSL